MGERKRKGAKQEAAPAAEQVAAAQETEQALATSYTDFDAHCVEILETEELDRDQKAELLLEFVATIGDSNERDLQKLMKKVRHDVLPELYGDSDFRTFGREIADALKNGPIEEVELADKVSVPQLATLPETVRHEVVNRFIDGKLLKRSKNGETIKLGTAKHALRGLQNGDMDTARYVQRIFSVQPVEISSLDDAEKLLEDHDTERRVQEIRIQSEYPTARILPINELRLGHQDGRPGLQLVREWIDKVEDMKPEERPGAILVSNLVQGDFAHSQSKKRASLANGFQTMKNQFATAKLLLDEIRSKTDTPVILSLGPDDHRMAHDYTLDVVAELQKFVTGIENFISYYGQNRLMQTEGFHEHKKFQIQYMLPLCYHLGRPLRSKEVMSEETGGEITRSEYLMLYDHIVMGQPLHPALGISPESLKGLGEWRDNTIVVDDADIVFETAGTERLIRYRHVEQLSPDTLAQNHTDNITKMLGNLGTNGYKLPDATMTGRAQEAVYMTASGVPVEILPGLTDPAQSLDSSQYYRTITGDASLRANMTRRRLWTPTMTEFELTDEGDTINRYINKKILDKADSIPRTAVFELCDIQKGSPTSRTDYFVKYLSYILETAERMPIAIQWAGDIIHGHIYPGFADESQAVGLIQIQSQKLAIEDTLMKAWGHPDIPRELLNSFIDILVQQGNHDEIQRKRTPNNNDSNIDYLIKAQQQIFDKKRKPSIVRHNAIFHTPDGTPVPTWMGTTHLGAYTLKTAHYHLERGGSNMKGTTGMPLYHPYQRAQGLGDQEHADIRMGAHWHNEMSGMIGDTLIVMGGADASRSQFEDMRGLDAKMAFTVVFLGGGEPIEVRNIHAENLDNRPIKYGFFTPQNLAEHGYFTDDGFDPAKHGPYSNDAWPKSDVQKALRDIERQASQLVTYESQMENPNVYDTKGRFVHGNVATSRAFKLARTAFKGA